jgi:tetratricopeptide (TPR) repeat protein
MNRFARSYCYLLLLAFFTTGCASQYLSNYQTAQEAFNRAAAASNQVLLNPENALTTSPESEYRTARAFIMKAMGDSPNSSQEDHGKTKLASDGLLLTAYNIRALSEWKLGMYNAALQTASACRQTFANDASIRQQRDYVVMEVMQALIYNDSIASYIKKIDVNRGVQEPSSEDLNYLKMLAKSMDIVKEQRLALEAENPLQSYLCITQLSIAKNWKNLVFSLTQQMKRQQSDKLSTWNNDWKEQRQKLNEELQQVFADLKSNLPEQSSGIYDIWKKAHIDVAGI